MKTLYLLRGISGSGKSTLAKQILEREIDSGCTAKIFSTDNYFINSETGEYVFEGAKIGIAHQWNQKSVEEAMEAGMNSIIVDNTNTQRWEAKPYAQLAQKFGYEWKVVEPETTWKKDAQILAEKNVHGVPREAIQRMLDRWEDDFSLEAVLNSKPPRRAPRKKLVLQNQSQIVPENQVVNENQVV